MKLLPHRVAGWLRVLAAAPRCRGPVAACHAAAAGAHDTEDSNALIMTAEIALQRNDCGRAAANYTIAAQRLSDLKLAERAASVALDCGQYQAAERAAARWRQLTAHRPGRAARRDAGGTGSVQDR